MLNFCLLPTEIFSKRRKIYAIWAEDLRYNLMNLSSRATREPCQISWKPGWFRPKTSRPDKATGLHDFETAFCKNVSRERGWKHKSRGKIPRCHRHHDNGLAPAPSLVSKMYLLWLKEWNLWSALTFLVNGHIMLNAPVLVRSPKLSSIEPRQYLDGWPPGNTGCCWQINFFFAIFYLHWHFDKKSCFDVFFHRWNPQFNFSSKSKSQYRTWFFSKATQDMTDTPYFFLEFQNITSYNFLDLLWSDKKESHFQRSRANSKLPEDQPWYTPWYLVASVYH